MDDEAMIRVWRFHDAPEEYRNLSTNGGDEDWLALVPPAFNERHIYIPWLNVGSFGACDVDEYPLESGAIVYIGCHA